MPLSVLHALAPAHVGGLETVVAQLAVGLTEAGARVTVAPIVAPGEAKEHPFVRSLLDTGVDVAPVEVSGRGYLTERNAIGRLIARTQADALHTHGYRPDVVDSGMAARVGIPRVTTVHGFTGNGAKNRFYEALQRRVFRRFDAVIAVSAALERELVASGVPSPVVRLVPNAFAGTRRSMRREEARAKLELPTDVPIIGWVGRLSPEKAPDIFVRAAAADAGREARYSVIGTGPELRQCQELAADLGMADRVRFHGQVPDAGSLLPAFDALTLTSWTEGTPMVLLEAMSLGVPVVTTAVGGIPDVVSSEEAILVQAGDADAVSRGLTRLLEDQTLARSLAEAARSRLRSDFAIAPWVSRHLEIYHSLTGR